MPLPAGRIGLQHNKGYAAFKNIRIRPIGLKPLLDAELTQWQTFPDKPGKFEVTSDGELHVTGGRGQIESKESFGNFVALIEAKTQSEKLNSGVFFRSMPASDMNGYECQINHGISDGNPLKPLDCGTGGIFRRTNARIVAAKDQEWFSMLLVADGLQFCAWVNGCKSLIGTMIDLQMRTLAMVAARQQVHSCCKHMTPRPTFCFVRSMPRN